MALKFPNTTRQAMAQAIVDILNAGSGDPKMMLYATEAIGGIYSNEIAEIVFPNPIEDSVVNGVITLNEQTAYNWTNNDFTEMTAVTFELVNSLDVVALKGDIGTSGTSYELSTLQPILTPSRGLELVTRTITIGNPDD